MKIAMFSDNFNPELSGISDSIIMTGKELVALGHEIRFYCPKYSLADYKKVGLEMKEIDLGNGISVHRLFSIPVKTGTGQGRLVIPLGAGWRSLKKWKPDIIHSHLIFGVGLEGLIAAKKLKVPFIGTNHTSFRQFIDHLSEWLRKVVLKYVTWYYNKCDFVTAPSEFLLKEMVADGFNKPHQSISNPVDTKRLLPVDDVQKMELKKQLNFSDKVVIYAGRLAVEKNIDVMVRAFSIVSKKLPKASLVLVGQGPAKKDLEKLANELGVGGSVKFTGYLGGDDLVKAYQASDIFAVTSTSETQCLSMMNAMAVGIPVVGVEAGGLAQYINEDNGYKIKSDDHEAVAEKIISLLENSELRKKLGQGGYEFAQQFSISAMANHWAEIYKRFIK